MEGENEVFFFLITILSHGLFWGCYLEFKERVPHFVIRLLVILVYATGIVSTGFLYPYGSSRSPALWFILLGVTAVVGISSMAGILIQEAFVSNKQKSKQ
jgi:hypothetical protein